MTSLQAVEGAAVPVGPKAVAAPAPSEVYEAGVKARVTEGPCYPLMTAKLFPALDQLESAVEGLGKNPTLQAVQDSKLRNICRWVLVLSEAYGDSYEKKPLHKAQRPVHDLANMAGAYKDSLLIEEQAKTLFPGGVLPSKMQKKIKAMQKESAEEFGAFLKDLRKHDLPKALKILRSPAPLEQTDPAEIQRKDRRHLARALDDLVDCVGEVGLFHKDPEKFHDGRKTLRNIYAFIYATADVVPYRKEDVDTLLHLFTSYGEAQDKHIAQMWLEENGFRKEADVMLATQKELQKTAMEEAERFLASGTLESIGNSVRATRAA